MIYWIMVLPILIVIAIIFAYFNIKVVPQGEAWIIERLGKFHRVSKPGIRMIIFHPFYEKVRKEVIIKEQILDVPNLEVITKDNVLVTMNAVAFIKVKDPKNATYAIVNYKQGILTLVKTSIRSIVGNMKLDEALTNREKIKNILKTKIIEDTHRWGIDISLVEIVDLHPSASMQKAMEKQATAERERRALEITASGEKAAEILKAEAHLEVAKIHAQAHHIEVEASAHALKEIDGVNNTGDSNMPLNYILGEKYLDTLKSLSGSDNSK
ncbi:MAG TPA: SPFH/Band 7/PHB domain protein, partial [Nitratifractor sp.]|nr:SPFH/Band 7/PHB domain protein [Nitratifractor sp.]